MPKSLQVNGRALKLLLAAFSANYALDTASAAMNNPNNAPKTAPDQGLAVIPQVLPVHLPRYPMAPPIIAPTMIPIK